MAETKSPAPKKTATKKKSTTTKSTTSKPKEKVFDLNTPVRVQNVTAPQKKRKELGKTSFFR